MKTAVMARPMAWEIIAAGIELAVLALLPALAAAGTQPALIAVSANVQFAARDLVSAFEAETGYDLDLVVGSSGKLTAQISNGAPFDLFLSADLGYPEELIRSGFAREVRVYALGSLVLASTRYADLSGGLSLLRDANIRKIAIADPLIAPYGAQALHALEALGLAAAVRHKLVFGKNIAQASQYILSGSVDLGITARSFVAAQQAIPNLNWVAVDSAAYDPISQGAVILQHGRKHHPDLSTAFLRFLLSDAAAGILRRHGYSLP